MKRRSFWKRRRRRRRRKKEEQEGNITIALFNPDRGTNKHVLSSFKKVPVFFLSLGYVEIERDRHIEEKNRRGKKNCPEHHHHHHHHENQRKRNERANSVLFFPSSLSSGDSYSTRKKICSYPSKSRFDEKISSLSTLPPPSSNEHSLLLTISIHIFFSSYIFPRQLKRIA
jgi:hypothetical protein